MSGFYAGSHVLAPFEAVTGLSVDKLNFIVCQLIGISVGYPFQTLFSASPNCLNYHRYIASMLLGSLLCIFCFGSQIFHLLTQASAGYLLMRYIDQKYSRYLVSVFAIVYLSVCHCMRQYYDYGGYTVDVTGPLMIQTQKLSSLAFNLYDGAVMNGEDEEKKSAMTKLQRTHFVRNLPNPLQFYSYTMHYQGILAGPFLFYSEFRDFMEGRILEPEGVGKRDTLKYIRGFARIGNRVLWVIFCALVTVLLGPRIPFEHLSGEEYNGSPLWYKWCYLMSATFILRQRYYFAWSLGELCYLCSGCGFSGYNPVTKQPEYKVVQNFDAINIESASSLKMVIDNWNIGTLRWLRECIYERVSREYATLAVFLASAFWHGFYPGYYLMFMSHAFFIILGRMIRRQVRPFFMRSRPMKLLYDTVTVLAAVTVVNYCAAPFVLLQLQTGWNFWRSWYFSVHAVGLAAFICLKFAANFGCVAREKLKANFCFSNRFFN